MITLFYYHPQAVIVLIRNSFVSALYFKKMDKKNKILTITVKRNYCSKTYYRIDLNLHILSESASCMC